MKKKLIIAGVIIAIVLVIVMIAFYISEKHFRDWIDVYILRKDITEEELPTISLNADKSNQIHVYGKNIALLNNRTIELYNGSAEKVASIDVDINSGLFDSREKYLAIAENYGNKVYLIFDKTYLWSTTVEGEILQIHVNPNGYVAVVTTDSTHKSILTLFDYSGKKLLKSYFASTRIIDVSISRDNKYIAVGELDASGVSVQSNIKVISVDKAQNDSENATVYTYNADSGNLIVNVEYQDKGQIVCLYDKSIGVIKNEESKEIFKVEDDSITFMTVNFSNNIAYVKEESGMFKSKTDITILNTSNNSEKLILLEDCAKEIYAKDNILEVNIGTEANFYDTNGWLKKKFKSEKEITSIEFSDSLAAVIYKDKIIVINL